MRCEHSRELMSLMLDEILTPEQRRDLEQHLNECVGCRAEWKLLKTAQRLIATTKPAPMPYDLVPIVMERVKAIERERTKANWLFNVFRPQWRWLAAATVPIMLALAIVGVRFWRAPHSEPPESIYWSAHVTNAAEVAAAPELAPISVALSSLPFAGEKK
ncbi:MAG: zf-HC2 domain-containing protein [Armatimonadetes bacterium]|nr:zf-HC2 domain-containing protein [Armatimonadota bacterium]MCX7966935.1 zf-HC2 domain-containing protein [Armatimonadota bacterium]MDW8142450.1 zf-HC2 domain-containing protein [Armatimonadota bacterium]